MTQTIFIDGAQYSTAKELHLALKMLLKLPDHYGCNADALYDCLSERREPVKLVVISGGGDEVNRALRICCRVVEDLGGETRWQ